MNQGVIKKLDKNLINQIAAGEVVERPSSVVKELLENSLDAGSKTIKMELINGGIDLIRITDDGKGVDKIDFPLLLVKHATSKIQTINDLENTFSLGFRGEALASISSVSQFVFASKTKESPNAFQIDQNGEISPCALNQGTKVEVKNLFYNVPARKEYLKTPNTEYSNIVKFLTGYFLAYPEVSFQVYHNSKLAFNLSSEPLEERIQKVLGPDFKNKVIPIEYQSSNVTLKGVVSRPEFCVAKKPEQHLIVNSRPLKPEVFSVAARNAFGSLIFPNQKPQFVLNIQIDPNQVDMNVHPRKTEARFKFQSILFAVVLKTIKNALEKTNLQKLVELKRPSLESFFEPNNSALNESYPKSNQSQVQEYPAKDGFSSYSKQDAFSSPNNPSYQSYSSSPKSYDRQKFQGIDHYAPSNGMLDLGGSEHNQSSELFENSLKYIGQMKNSYLLFEGDSGLTIIDQHAAHEKVRYFEIRQMLENLQKLKQPLLQKEELSLSIQKIEVLKNSMPVFKKLGFDFEISDSNKVYLLAVPNDLVKFSPHKLLEGLLDDFQNQNHLNLQTLEDIAINYAACRSAIKFGQKMTPLEVDSLIKALDKLKHEKYSCPHGRPSTISISADELEKLFLRKK